MSQMAMARESAALDPRSLVRGLVRLVSLPDVVVRVNELMDDPRSTTADIGQLVGRDTGLSARLLKIVNSAFYGFPSRVETISRAITIIGTHDLRNLLLATTAVRMFARIPSELIDTGSFWRHSVYCGLVGRSLAAKCNVLHSERLFVAGLLHDVGKLIICNRLPDVARDAYLIADGDPVALLAVERELLGFDHADVGGELLLAWNLPPALQQAVALHHRPAEAGEYTLEPAIVHLADAIADMAEHDIPVDEKLGLIDPTVWSTTGLSHNIVQPAMRAADQNFREVLEVIVPRTHQAR